MLPVAICTYSFFHYVVFGSTSALIVAAVPTMLPETDTAAVPETSTAASVPSNAADVGTATEPVIVASVPVNVGAETSPVGVPLTSTV